MRIRIRDPGALHRSPISHALFFSGYSIFFLSGRGKAAAADNSKAVVRRFVRSIARLFVVLSIETPPSQNKKKSPAAAVQPLQRCKRAFQVKGVLLAEFSQSKIQCCGSFDIFPHTGSRDPLICTSD
jgi:hypothetical protein